MLHDDLLSFILALVSNIIVLLKYNVINPCVSFGNSSRFGPGVIREIKLLLIVVIACIWRCKWCWNRTIAVSSLVMFVFKCNVWFHNMFYLMIWIAHTCCLCFLHRYGFHRYGYHRYGFDCFYDLSKFLFFLHCYYYFIFLFFYFFIFL